MDPFSGSSRTRFAYSPAVENIGPDPPSGVSEGLAIRMAHLAMGLLVLAGGYLPPRSAERPSLAGTARLER
jgi:hypothetical protein